MPDGQIEIRLTRAQRIVAGLPNSSGITQLFDISEFNVAKSLPQAQRDFTLLANILERYPGETTEVIDYILAGEMSRAQELASKIGLTEKDFQEKGGGLPFLLIVICIGCLFLAHD
jgi:hypothetical protein